MEPVKNTIVSVNKPLDYEAEKDAVLRRQKYAEMLGQSALQPIEAGSYNGIQAPISPVQGLAKILEGAGAGYLENRAAEEKRELETNARTDATAWFEKLNAGSPDSPEGGDAPMSQRERMAMILQGMTSDNPRIPPVASALYAEAIKKPDDFTLGEGQQRFSRAPGGGSPVRVAGVPAKSEKPPYQEREFPISADNIQKQFSSDHGVTWQNIGAPYERRDPFIMTDYTDENGRTYRVAVPRSSLGKTGQTPGAAKPSSAPAGAPPTQAPGSGPSGAPGIIIGGGGPAKQTEVQSNAQIFAERMARSNWILGDFENQGTDYWANIAGQMPGGAGNYVNSQQWQQYDQAKRDFINAALRKESGAAIGASEFANAEQQYFPQPGNGPDVIAQKRANRETAMKQIANAAGPSYKLPKRPLSADEQKELETLRARFRKAPAS